MSRLGDLIMLERSRQKLTRKQVAKTCGISEGYLKDVEEGRRIIQDDQARRILRTLGTNQRNEAEFSLDEIAATVDLSGYEGWTLSASLSASGKKITQKGTELNLSAYGIAVLVPTA